MPEPEGPPPLPPLVPEKDFSAILNAFEQADCTVPDLLLALLTEKRFKDSAYTCGVLQRSGDVLRAWLSHARLPQEAEKAASEALHQVYACEIKKLVKPSSGWHFSAHTVMPDDIDDFDINDLTLDTAEHAPCVSALLDTLLSANKQSRASLASQTDADGDISMAAGRDSDSDSDSDRNGDATPKKGTQGHVAQTRMKPLAYFSYNPTFESSRAFSVYSCIHAELLKK